MPGVLLCCLACQAHRGAPLTRVLLCRSVHQAFDGPASLVQLPMLAYGEKESMVMAAPRPMTQQYHLSSLAAGLSSTGISHHNLLPHSQQQPSSWDCSQSLNSSSQPLRLPGDLHPCLGYVGCGKDCLILSPFKLPQMNHFTLSLKWFSSDSDYCPDVGIRPLLHFPHPLRAGPVILTLLFFPSSFILPSFAWVYIFFSTGQALLSALSWCSACTSVSEDVFLMYTWSEMYSTSTCYSTILFFLSIL